MFQRQTFMNISIKFKIFERKDSTKIGIAYRQNKDPEAYGHSKSKKNSKLNVEKKKLDCDQQNLLDSNELQNFLFNFRDEISNDKQTSNDMKSLSFSNKHKNTSASPVSNNFIKVKEPICPDNSKVSNTSLYLNKNNSYSYSKQNHDFRVAAQAK